MTSEDRQKELADRMWKEFARYPAANPNSWAQWAADFYEPRIRETRS